MVDWLLVLWFYCCGLLYMAGLGLCCLWFVGVVLGLLAWFCCGLWLRLVCVLNDVVLVVCG